MSNTSRVTPFDAAGAVIGAGVGLTALCVVGVAKATISAGRWLLKDSEEEKSTLKRDDEERRRERLQVYSTPLHLRDTTSLLRSAQQLGYHQVPLATTTAATNLSLLLLQKTTGERLAIERTAKGRVVIHSATDQSRVHALVKQHTLDRAVAHFANKGMTVQTQKLTNGEVQIKAQEQGTSRRDGAATVTTQIGSDGAAVVDVNCVRGNRCESIVSEFAEAIGGAVSDTVKKDAYYQLPGEPTKTRVRA